MSHPAVREAGVVAHPAHPKWQERPLAVVLLKDGARVTVRRITSVLIRQIRQKWQMPDDFVFGE